MKAICKWTPLAVVLALWMVGTALAAMSDAKALSEARRLFGVMGNIGTERGQTDTYWNKIVGVRAPGCKEEFVTLGRGQNTWEAAFAAVDYLTAVQGPLSGEVILRNEIRDDEGVSSYQWILDGKPLGPEIKYDTPAQRVTAEIVYRSSTGPQGIHVICGWAKDRDGKIGRSPGFVVSFDQTADSPFNMIYFKGDSSPQFVERHDDLENED